MDDKAGVPPPYAPPQGYPPPQEGYPPPQQGYPPPQQSYQQGYPPQGYPPQGYPPQGYPPQGYPPQAPVQAGSTNVVVIQQPTQPVRFGSNPVFITDSRGQQVMTRLEYRSGGLAWLICCAICWLTGCWCIALIPFCVDGAKDVYHISPTDNTVVGVYKRL